jgi:GH35 family endo-1,4-beta-xylanase
MSDFSGSSPPVWIYKASQSSLLLESLIHYNTQTHTMIAATLLTALLPLIAASPVARQDGVNKEALRTLAAAQNKYFGTAYQSFYLADPRFEPILDGEFDQYTPENEMKWEVIQAERGVFNWTGADLVCPLVYSS